jgi:hypothetical protein
MESRDLPVAMLRSAAAAAGAILAASFAASCGSGVVGDCSGGSPVDGTCVSTQPTVTWTPPRAAAALGHFSYAPMVPGRLSGASCRISARYGGHEASATCVATFTPPHRSPRRIRVAVRLAGTGGVMDVECPRTASNNAYCRWQQAHP